MRYGLLFSLLFLTACATTAPVQKASMREMISPETVSPDLLEGLSYGDLISLDKSIYLVEVKSKKYKVLDDKIKRSTMLIVNEKFKQQSVDLSVINLKFWLKKQLNSKNYYVEAYLHGKIPVVVMVQYGQMPIQNKKVENLNMRYLRLIAVDYQSFKKNKTIVPLWESQISSVGPLDRAEDVIKVLASFIDVGIEQNFQKRYLIPMNDPVLNKTKETPSSIIIDELKPSLEELEFFN